MQAYAAAIKVMNAAVGSTISIYENNISYAVENMFILL